MRIACKCQDRVARWGLFINYDESLTALWRKIDFKVEMAMTTAKLVKKLRYTFMALSGYTGTCLVRPCRRRRLRRGGLRGCGAVRQVLVAAAAEHGAVQDQHGIHRARQDGLARVQVGALGIGRGRRD